jgi:hypothetical protein
MRCVTAMAGKTGVVYAFCSDAQHQVLVDLFVKYHAKAAKGTEEERTALAYLLQFVCTNFLLRQLFCQFAHFVLSLQNVNKNAMQWVFRSPWSRRNSQYPIRNNQHVLQIYGKEHTICINERLGITSNMGNLIPCSEIMCVLFPNVTHF